MTLFPPKKWLNTPHSTLEVDKMANIQSLLNSAGFDPWGLDPDTLRRTVTILSWFYRHYFRVVTHCIERVPQGRVILAVNHGGQIPIDGMLIFLALMLEGKPPRLARALTDRLIPRIPFISTLFMRCGHVIGTPQNGRTLLDQDQCIFVFPEGVRGSGKTIFNRYQLQKFGTGFIRLALETQTPIVPVAVIGAEEAFPAITHFKGLAKVLKIPYLPVTPLFPALGALGLMPLPTKVTIRFGKPIQFKANDRCSDSDVQKMNRRLKMAINRELTLGLKKRGKAIFTASAA